MAEKSLSTRCTPHNVKITLLLIFIIYELTYYIWHIYSHTHNTMYSVHVR